MVLARCRQVADVGVIDEAIGAMLTADVKPHSPNYLLSTVRTKLVTGGAYGEADERLNVLGIGSAKGAGS